MPTPKSLGNRRTRRVVSVHGVSYCLCWDTACRVRSLYTKTLTILQRIDTYPYARVSLEPLTCFYMLGKGAQAPHYFWEKVAEAAQDDDKSR